MSRRDFVDAMWSDACSMLERAERLHRSFFGPSVTTSGQIAWQPPIDVYETDTGMLVFSAMPGVVAEQLDVRLEGSTLVISGSRTLPRVSGRAIVRRLEIPHGRFERQVSLIRGSWRIERQDYLDGCLVVSLSRGRSPATAESGT